jgi:hypothetical protein
MFGIAVEAPENPGFWDLNLIHLFGFYLAIMFLVGLYRRVAQYRAIGTLALAGPARWPRLIALVKQHGTVFMTWSTFLPAVLALLLTLVHFFASRWLWPHADVTPGRLAGELWIWPVLVIFGVAMIAIDLYCVIVIGQVDQTLLQKYFDEAEYWLRSWTAPVVKFISLGRINPRKMVSVEVQKALVAASALVNANLWWMTAQIGLRVSFGLALWLAYALVPM